MLTETLADLLQRDEYNRLQVGTSHPLTPARAALRDKLLNEHRLLIVGEKPIAASIMPAGLHVDLVRVTGPLGNFRKLCDPNGFATVYETKIADVDRPEAIGDDEAKYLRMHLDFLYDMRGLAEDVIIFHCWAGVQRSAAVALAYTRLAGLKEAEALITGNDLFAPHMCVVDKIVRAGE